MYTLRKHNITLHKSYDDEYTVYYTGIEGNCDIKRIKHHVDYTCVYIYISKQIKTH